MVLFISYEFSISPVKILFINYSLDYPIIIKDITKLYITYNLELVLF